MDSCRLGVHGAEISAVDLGRVPADIAGLGAVFPKRAAAADSYADVCVIER